MSLDIAALCAGFLVAGYAVGGLRRGNVRKHVIGVREISVITSAEPTVAFAAVAHVGAPYRVDDSDAESRRLVLSTRPTVFSFGFLYPIEITAFESGSKITIGIRSKFLYGGMIVTAHAHERCARMIEALFAVPPMRVT